MRLTKSDWAAWHDENKRYAARPTEGLDADLKALEEHIAKLKEVAPKDKAGYLQTNALIYLNQLQMRLDSVKSYLSRV